MIIYTCLSSSSERLSASFITVFAHYKFFDWSNQRAEYIISFFPLGECSKYFLIHLSDKLSGSWLRITVPSTNSNIYELTSGRSQCKMNDNKHVSRHTRTHIHTRYLVCRKYIRMYLRESDFYRARAKGHCAKEKKKRKKNLFGFG